MESNVLKTFGEVSLGDTNKVVVVVVSYNGKPPVVDVQKLYREDANSNDWLFGKRPHLGDATHCAAIAALVKEAAAYLAKQKAKEKS